MKSNLLIPGIQIRTEDQVQLWGRVWLKQGSAIWQEPRQQRGTGGEIFLKWGLWK